MFAPLALCFELMFSAQRSKRQNLAFEFLETERSYCALLQVCVEAYKRPMLEQQLVAASEIGTIFINIDFIARLSRELILSPLEERLANYDDEKTELADILESSWTKVPLTHAHPHSRAVSSCLFRAHFFFFGKFLAQAHAHALSYDTPLYTWNIG
jgi:hypothetical protein